MTVLRLELDSVAQEAELGSVEGSEGRGERDGIACLTLFYVLYCVQWCSLPPPTTFFIFPNVCVFGEGELEFVMVRLATISTECWRCVWEGIDVL